VSMKPFNLIALISSMSACVIPLGSSGPARSTPTLTTARSELCDSIDRERSVWTVIATGLGGLSGTTGLSALPASDPDTKRALAIAAGSSGLASAFAGVIAADRAQRWVRAGCQ
jgi:hypothetical protein